MFHFHILRYFTVVFPSQTTYYALVRELVREYTQCDTNAFKLLTFVLWSDMVCIGECSMAFEKKLFFAIVKCSRYVIQILLVDCIFQNFCIPVDLHVLILSIAENSVEVPSYNCGIVYFFFHL